jgi:HEAT repeat protein
MRGKPAVNAAHDDLTRAMMDAATCVEITAAQALAQFGEEADLEPALALLATAADWSRNDVFTAMAALNSLDQLGAKAGSAAEAIRLLPSKGASPTTRYGEYVPRLVNDLQERFR